MIKQAEKYAKSITKNETYQMYLINAFIEGYKLANKNPIHIETEKRIENKEEFSLFSSWKKEEESNCESTFKHFQD